MVLNKIKFFIWWCCNISLAVRANLIRRRMRVDSSCALCGGVRETEQHLFFKCEFSRVMWYCSSLQLNMKPSTGKDFGVTWHDLCNRFRDEDRKDLILQEYVFIMWRIWKCQNAALFKGEAANPMEEVTLVRNQIMEFRAAHNPFKHDASVRENGDRDSFAGTPVRWRRPTCGVLKVNCDDA